MFQRAYGIALEARGYNVAYDRSQLVEGTHREYSLGGFQGDVRLTEDAERAGDIRPVTAMYQEGMRYDEKYFNLGLQRSMAMVGYWQSEQYFKNVIPKVLQAFQFKDPLSPTAAYWLDEIGNSCCDATFLHVRRKDYVGLQNVHGMPTLKYYSEALTQVPHGPVYVFSDDIEWCRQSFLGHGFHFVEGTTKFEDLQLMKACRHAIIANSSFSWWGAWLGDCWQPRTVIAPKQWFNPAAGIDDTDIVPARWRKM
jgi:hypothetical protein